MIVNHIFAPFFTCISLLAAGTAGTGLPLPVEEGISWVYTDTIYSCDSSDLQDSISPECTPAIVHRIKISIDSIVEVPDTPFIYISEQFYITVYYHPDDSDITEDGIWGTHEKTLHVTCFIKEMTSSEGKEYLLLKHIPFVNTISFTSPTDPSDYIRISLPFLFPDIFFHHTTDNTFPFEFEGSHYAGIQNIGHPATGLGDSSITWYHSRFGLIRRTGLSLVSYCDSTLNTDEIVGDLDELYLATGTRRTVIQRYHSPRKVHTRRFDFLGRALPVHRSHLHSSILIIETGYATPRKKLTL